MKIKDFRKVSLGKTLAFFSLEWDDDLTINDMKIVEGRNGIFVSAPSREYLDKKTNQKKWASIVYIGQDVLEKINKMAQEEYGEVSKQEPDIPF